MNEKFFKKLLIKTMGLKGILILFIVIAGFFLVGLYNDPSKDSGSFNGNLTSIKTDGEYMQVDNSSDLDKIDDKTNKNVAEEKVDTNEINAEVSYSNNLLSKDDYTKINSSPQLINTTEESKKDVNEAEIKEKERLNEIAKINSNINWNTNTNAINMLLPSANYENRTELTTHILLHFISNAYNSPRSPYDINAIYSILRDYELSSHYIIDRDGQIYIFTPENMVAYHAGSGNISGLPSYSNKLNQHSIGIELLGIGTREEMIPVITESNFNLVKQEDLGFTDAQYNSLNTLINDILSRHSNIKRDRSHILGHDEYNPSKTDPGSLFNWSKIGF